MPISFQKEEVEFDMPDEGRLTKWLEGVANSQEKKIVQISYIFCTDDYLLNINKEYLGHDFYTDIITFPYKQGKEIESDIFISIDRVKDNASSYNTSFEQELLRVIAHGLLHLLGYKDKSEEDQKKMTEREDWAVEEFYKT